jgi:lipid II:glycine glycyltransferase (peptidoglycan interpeptide bridge formation enzyme)
MNISKIELFTDKRYDHFVNTHPHASFFHSSQWAQVLADSYGFKPFCISLVSDNAIVGLLPLFETRTLRQFRHGVSLPFSDMCEPLLDYQEDFSRIFEKCIEIGKNNHWRYIELRGGERLLSAEPAFETILTHEIELWPSDDTLFKSFHSTTGRNIHHAQKEGITVTHSTSYEALQHFYRLNSLTRREHGLPPQPWRFFLNLWETALKLDLGFISLATYHNTAIAANLYLIHNEKAIYKFGASDRAYQRQRASSLVMWEGIKKCKEMGCRYLNFGRTEMHHEGLLQFKRGFGCKETTLNYYRYDLTKNRFIQGNAHSRNKLPEGLMTKLPIPLLRFLGTVFYKYSS